MIVGITGTRHGCTPAQYRSFSRFLAMLVPSGLYHGDCAGVDSEATDIAAELTPRPHIVAFPGPDSAWSGRSANNDEVMAPESHFARNRRIVDTCDLLVAVPFSTERADCGGTEYTIAYAMKRRQHTYLVLLDGGVIEHVRNRFLIGDDFRPITYRGFKVLRPDYTAAPLPVLEPPTTS